LKTAFRATTNSGLAWAPNVAQAAVPQTSTTIKMTAGRAEQLMLARPLQ
jgi:hypothetical protein